MEAIITIKQQNGNSVVSARELYLFLEIKTDFTKWCKRMFEYGFSIDVDYSEVVAKNDSNLKGGRSTLIDYALTLDTAKEISMLQRNDKGKQARQYFIEVEKQAKKPMTQMEILLHSAQMLVDQERRIESVETRVLQIEAKTTTRPDYFTIVGYGTISGISVNLSLAANLGRQASSICKKRELLMDTIPDPRFGLVRMYPKEVLDEVFKNHILTKAS